MGSLKSRFLTASNAVRAMWHDLAFYKQCLLRNKQEVVGRIHVAGYMYTKITDVPMFSIFPFGKRRYAPYLLHQGE